MAGTFELVSPLRECVTMKVTIPTGGVDEGEVLNVGEVWGFVFATADPSGVNNSIPATEQYTLIVRAPRVNVNKDSSSVTQGNEAFWNSTDGNVSDTAATTEIEIGYFLEGAAGGVSDVDIFFDGSRDINAQEAQL